MIQVKKGIVAIFIIYFLIAGIAATTPPAPEPVNKNLKDTSQKYQPRGPG